MNAVLRPSAAGPTISRILIALVAALFLVGCSASNSPNATLHRTRSASHPDELKDLWADFRRTAGLPTVPLRAPADLRPAPGFNQADVNALASRALDILKRSAQPRLSRMKPADAIDYVYAHQYAATTFDFKTNASGYTGGYYWQWLAASRYATPPTVPRAIKVLGTVTTGSDKLDDGQPARYLTVTLQAHLVQTVQTAKYGRVPIVVRRTVRASAFRPRGGPDWWPSVLTRSSPFGNDGCHLFKGATLVPFTTADDLRKDLADLKNSLGSKVVIRENFNDNSSPKKVGQYIRKICSQL